MKELHSKIRVLIADDYAVLRAGLRILLNSQPDMEVIGEACNSHEAVSQTVKLAPDVLLLDITMPGVGGMDIIRITKAGTLPVAEKDSKKWR